MNYDVLCVRAARLAELRLPAVFVAPLRRTAAAWGARWTAEQLGGRVPTGVFCKQSSVTDPVWGAATPGDGGPFYVVDGLSPSETVAIAAEEAHHALTLAGDEIAGRSCGRAAAAAWMTDRYDRRRQLERDFLRLTTRLGYESIVFKWRNRSPDDGRAWDRVITRALADCYGNGVVAVGVKVGREELALRLAELDQLDAYVPLRRHAAVELPAAPPLLATWSWDRTPRRRNS